MEGGYEVSGLQGVVLGVAASFQAARALLPDGAHERLHEVHGVRLSKSSRAAIQEKGSQPGVDAIMGSGFRMTLEP